MLLITEGQVQVGGGERNEIGYRLALLENYEQHVDTLRTNSLVFKASRTKGVQTSIIYRRGSFRCTMHQIFSSA